MKISECKNAPQWLIDASTHNADVDIDEDGFVTWHGGDWHGGDWWGGDWHGGDWWGESLKTPTVTIYSLK